jgi:Tol biopolymer transport system component
MGKTIGFVTLMMLLLITGHLYSQEQKNVPALESPYLGQKKPGKTPLVFAPGVVSSEAHEFGCCFSPDGKEFYFTRRVPSVNRNVIMVTQFIDGSWTKPKIADLNGDYGCFEPRITPDGKRMYFTSSRPVPEGGPPMNIWFVEREGNTWGTPKNPGGPFNPMKTMYISSSKSGTIYTTDISSGPGQESILCIESYDGIYQESKKLGPPINMGTRDMYPFIASDETYMIFCSERPSDSSKSEMFVSFRNKNGGWKEPLPVDLGMKAGLPLVTPDGEFLFFTGGEKGKSDIFWVSAEIFRGLKPNDLD